MGTRSLLGQSIPNRTFRRTTGPTDQVNGSQSRDGRLQQRKANDYKICSNRQFDRQTRQTRYNIRTGYARKLEETIDRQTNKAYVTKRIDSHKKQTERPDTIDRPCQIAETDEAAMDGLEEPNLQVLVFGRIVRTNIRRSFVRSGVSATRNIQMV